MLCHRKLFWQNRLLLKLGKHPNWQKNRHKIKSSRRCFKGKIWNNVRNLSHKKFLLTTLSFSTHAFITLGRYFHLFRRNSASAFKMTLYKSNCAPHMGVFVKKLCIAFTEFGFACYQTHRKQKMCLVQEVFVIFQLRTYYLLDSIEIRPISTSFSHKNEIIYQIFSCCLFHLLLVLSNPENASVVTISSSDF